MPRADSPQISAPVPLDVAKAVLTPNFAANSVSNPSTSCASGMYRNRLPPASTRSAACRSSLPNSYTCAPGSGCRGDDLVELGDPCRPGVVLGEPGHLGGLLDGQCGPVAGPHEIDELGAVVCRAHARTAGDVGHSSLHDHRAGTQVLVDLQRGDRGDQVAADERD